MTFSAISFSELIWSHCYQYHNLECSAIMPKNVREDDFYMMKLHYTHDVIIQVLQENDIK